MNDPADGSVEVFLPTDIALGGEDHGDNVASQDVVIVPDTPTRAPINKAKKRWRKIKFVMKMTCRRTSLTKVEEEFLENINKGKRQELFVSPLAEDDAGTSEEKEDMSSEARTKLQSILAHKSSVLTDAERSFLSSLLTTPGVSDEQLEKCREVLMSDPIYKQQHPNEKKEMGEEKEDAPFDDGKKMLEENKMMDDDHDFTKQRPQRLPSCSFRDELWQFHTVSSYADKNSIKYQTKSASKEHEQKSQEEKVDNAEQHSEEFGSSMSNFFNSFFQPQEKEEVKQEEEKEELHPFFILATMGAEDKDCRPHVLSPPIMDALRPHMPYAYQEDNYWLKYSMVRDGAHMRCLLDHARNSARTILAVETVDGDVFGSFTSTPWRPQGRTFYGSCEAFLWRLKKSRYTECGTVQEQTQLESEVEVFPWSKKNRNIQSLANPDSNLVLGGGGLDGESSPIEEEVGSALIVDDRLERGTSQKCLTFDSPCLLTNTDATEDTAKKSGLFEIANVEVWTMTPVEDVAQAEQLEYGRKFIFEHSHFVDK